MNTIARQIGVHHTTVQRVLAQSGIPSENVTTWPSVADPYVPFIVEILTKYPRLCASRMFEMVRERGYPGGPTTSVAWWPDCAHARRRKRSCACARCRASTRRWTGPTSARWTIGSALRVLYAFVMVLAWSRQLFPRFYLSLRIISLATEAARHTRWHSVSTVPGLCQALGWRRVAGIGVARRFPQSNFVFHLVHREPAQTAPADKRRAVLSTRTDGSPKTGLSCQQQSWAITWPKCAPE